MRWLVPIGRLLFSAIFILAAIGHFTRGEIEMAAQHGVPAARVLVPLSGLMALIGGLSILLGLRARFGALLLAVFLIVVTPVMHNFWAAPTKAEAMMQQGMFFKNVSMLGGALLILHFGSGPFSLDGRSRRS